MREACTLRPLYTAAQIRRKVRAIAHEVDRAYDGSEPVLVGVLKGSVIFLADLVRAMTVPVAIDFVRLSSYRGGVSPGARIRLTKDVETDVAGRDVLVVEEIVDTGRSVRFLRRHFERKRARSVRICALVDKRSRREDGITVEFTGFRAGGGFLVGYGMDHAESGRGLPDIFDWPGSRSTDHPTGGAA